MICYVCAAWSTQSAIHHGHQYLASRAGETTRYRISSQRNSCSAPVKSSSDNVNYTVIRISDMLIRTINRQTTRPTRFLVPSLIALVFVLLTACQGTMPPEEESSPEPEAASLPVPDEILPPSKRVQKAIRALQSGDWESARNQLNWALQEKPTLNVARKLLDQLDADPVEYLGESHFTHLVQAGESLSIIARDYLDDPLKFVILARYNGIEKPSDVKAGQQIRVPGSKRMTTQTVKQQLPERSSKASADTTGSSSSAVMPAETDRSPEAAPSKAAKQTVSPAVDKAKESASITQPEPAVRAEAEEAAKSQGPEEVMQLARQIHASGNLPGAIDLLEKTGNLSDQPKALRNQLIGYYSEHADRQATKGNLNDARTTLEKAVILDSSNESVINQLIAVEDKIESRRLYRQGVEMLKARKLPQAYELLSQALTYEPENSAIASARNQARDELTDNFHRQAMQLFRKHELDSAIEYWDRILAIDPQHSLAPGYRARAVELKEKLQKINQ